MFFMMGVSWCVIGVAVVVMKNCAGGWRGFWWEMGLFFYYRDCKSQAMCFRNLDPKERGVGLFYTILIFGTQSVPSIGECISYIFGGRRPRPGQDVDKSTPNDCLLFFTEDYGQRGLADLDNLPDPDVLASEIIENLKAGIDSFEEIMLSINSK